jgi:hypothetical protein
MIRIMVTLVGNSLVIILGRKIQFKAYDNSKIISRSFYNLKLQKYESKNGYRTIITTRKNRKGIPGPPIHLTDTRE